MPKIPTFKAEGSITQLAGTTNAPQIGLDQTLGNALSPLTDMVVKKAVQENDTQNRTEALRLGNEFTRKLNTLEDTIANDNTGLGVNKQSANSYYKQQTNNLINQFKSQASNNATATLFTNNALSAVNRGIFRIDTIVDKNVFKDLTTQVELAEKSLITQALFNNRDENVVDEFGMLGNVNDFDYASLQTNLTKLYTDAFSGKIPAANLNSMVNNIPALVQGFQANKDIYDNPSLAYTELNKGENSSVYPNLEVEQRIKLINKVETMMAQPLQVEFANVIFSLQDKGTEQPFDFNFAKKILPPEKYNELKTTYDLAKINAEDVRLIRTLPLDEADKLIESKNFGTDLYVGAADRITQAKLKEGLIKVRNNAEKQMLEDPVKFQIETSPEIEELTNNYRTETDPQIKLANRKILTNAIIEDQIKRGADLAKLKILTKQEVTRFKDQFLDTSKTSEDKLKLIEQLKVTFGNENMGKILNHLQDEKTPETILMAIATDSVELAKDLFDSSNLEDLKKVAVQKDIQPTDVLKKIMKKTEDFGEVLNSQGEGSESKAAKMLRINEALLKASLLRIDKNTSVDDAIESATNDFLKDYILNNSLTALIPKTINRITIPTAAVQNKAEAILIGIKDDSPGNYLERFMGEKGFMHYAESLNLSNVTEEDVKKRIGFTVRNYSKWLNNSDMTGMVLYADFGAAGMQPVVNADNQRVEFYFTDLPNQDPTIKDTISVYPVTGDELPLIPDPPSDDYFQYNENLIDEAIDEGKKNSKIPVDDQSSIFKTIGDAIISPVAAGEATLGDKFLINKNVIDRIKKNENQKLFKFNKNIGRHSSFEGGLDTVGFGHKLTEQEDKSNTVYGYNIDTLTIEQANDILEKDLKKAINLVNNLGKNSTINLDTINPDAYNILVEMAFQMGSNEIKKEGLAGFEKTLQFIKDNEYKKASVEMLKSTWHSQTPKRAKRLSVLMAKIK